MHGGSVAKGKDTNNGYDAIESCYLPSQNTLPVFSSPHEKMTFMPLQMGRQAFRAIDGAREREGQINGRASDGRTAKETHICLSTIRLQRLGVRLALFSCDVDSQQEGRQRRRVHREWGPGD
ncbi:hypothetical protein NHX12_030185 [Muraenolepis orangiensis]|uniref:Uncharacterized protein n=1 Tax=Muraenolepis orangiensis TaxID=630683 RepID=A0A9Q0E859_9TELE|nr:hypothetical protein NHX12_030185 [Muraenolepis orangiensis]